MLAHLNAWFGNIGEVVEAHGGRVLTFIGNAVLATFPTWPIGSTALETRV
jgi:adenylate cyclase